MHFDVILSRAHVKGKKGLNDFKFGPFIGHFQSDDTASMAVKGLISDHQSTSKTYLSRSVVTGHSGDK